ncbi:hypothetical protein CDN99_01640 [Roseateles aquatilis]|uniref:Uncharacterized protein n=2 Tax=Roseateles aquatilis TaxID=431061 RepID=A0A246JKT4_9BURK|nr:hypothetical protein CDN99_01640 [Roseateles aquatilis]
MFTLYEDDVVGIDANPDLMHVRIDDGRLWLSDDARDDIEVCAGYCPTTDSPIQMLNFLRAACVRLQHVDAEGDQAEHAFMSFCVLKGLEHAIETHWQGVEAVGEFRPERLLMAFTAPTSPHMSLMLH